jgi:RHO1 GDP-GTP exchange protein 1/2
LLSIREMDEVIPQHGMKRSSSSLIPLRAGNTESKKTEGYPVTFRHLGKNFYEQVLYAANHSQRKKWLEFIDTAQQRLRSRADFFNVNTISAGFFGVGNQVNTVTPYGKKYDQDF